MSGRKRDLMVEQHMGDPSEGAKLDTVHHYSGMEPNEIDRRNVVVGLLATGAAAVLGRHFQQPIAHGPGSGEGGHDPGAAETEGLATEESVAEAEKAGISTSNWVTALPVAGMFGRQIGMNMSGEREFGTGSWADMAIVEGGRLIALSMTDKHQFEHEAKDIGISYGLMLALTSAAEATEHGEADEAALFDKNVRKIADGLNIGITPMPETSASAEVWAEYAAQKRRDVAETAAQNTALAAIIAPAATTYTSATLVNATTERMAQHVAELKYAERMSAALEERAESGQGAALTEEESLGLLEQALADTNETMNGPGGYVRLALTTSANIQGASFIGDPPNWFYLLKNGPSEWLKTSQYGFVAANVYSLGANAKWLSGQLGGDVASYGTYLKETVVKAGQTVAGMAKSFGLFDQSLRRNQAFANRLYDHTAELQGNGIDVEPIRDMLLDMPRSPFAFYDGFQNAVSKYSPFGTDRTAIEERDLARSLHDFRRAGDGMSNVHVDALEALINDTVHPVDAVDRMLRRYNVHHNSRLAEHLSDVLLSVAKGESSESDRSFLAELNLEPESEETEAHRLSLSQDLASKIDRIRDLRASADGMSDTERAEIDARIAEETDAIEGLLDEFEESMPFLPIDMRHAVKFFVAKEISADAIDKRLQPAGLSHSSKEVFSALATQILAANAVASLAKKTLELADDAGMPFEAQNAIVLLLAESLSGVADNVVAYLFAQDVLQEQYKKHYGEDAFEREGGAALLQTINSSALFAAVAGGALTKIGNGPNFKFELAEADIHERKIRIGRAPLTFDESKKNHFAWAGGALTAADSMRRLATAESGLVPAEQPGEEALARQELKLSSRRQLFASIIQR